MDRTTVTEAAKHGEVQLAQENQRSPPLALPSEIRNTIYAYILGEKTWQMVFGGAPTNKDKHGAALLATCRQINSETRLLPASLNTFVFNKPAIEWAGPWLAPKGVTSVLVEFDKGLVWGVETDTSAMIMPDECVEETVKRLARARLMDLKFFHLKLRCNYVTYGRRRADVDDIKARIEMKAREFAASLEDIVRSAYVEAMVTSKVMMYSPGERFSA